MQAAVGFTSPVNAPRFQKYMGMAGMYYPGKDERAKLRRILAQLLEEGPQQGPDGSPVPSVGLDPWDDAAMFSQLIAAWLNSDAGQQAQKENANGFQNAVAYWQAASKAASPHQPQAKLSVSYSADKDPQTAPAVLAQYGINIPGGSSAFASAAPGRPPAPGATRRG